MSGYMTHLLIGGVGGLVATHLVPPDLIAVVRVQTPVLAYLPEGLVILTSAWAATWPDIDEPTSFAGQRVRWTITILAGLIGGMLGMAVGSGPMRPILQTVVPTFLTPSVGMALGGALGMGVVGPFLGQQVLTGMRTMAGGHRRWTHSLCLSGPLALLAVVLWMLGMSWGAVIVGMLAWGQWLHLVGDLVTPSGVPLFYPVATRSVCLLPRSVATVAGEPLIAVVAVLVAGWVVRGF